MGDDKFIKKVGSVELWRDHYLDSKLRPDTANALAKPQTNFPNRVEADKYAQKYIIPLANLEAAINLAPILAQVAVDRIWLLLTVKEASRYLSVLSNEVERSVNNTVLALYKYFNIPYDLLERPSNDPLWLTVNKIYYLYERTLNGLRGGYKIYLFEPQIQGKTDSDGAYGFVRHTKLADGQRHPLEIYFRDSQPDDNGHVPWPQWLDCTDIHLQMGALTKWNDNGRLAALILHEATHKWANTTDECYKVKSIAQEFKGKGNAWRLAQRIKDGSQPQLLREGKKPLLPLAKDGVTVDRWVYNADSYAWAARRMWKEDTEKGKREYTADLDG
jgi:hypothetical protein